MSSEAPTTQQKDMIKLRDIGRRYEIYNQPMDRLKQAFIRGRRQLFREFWALRNINLDVWRGEALGILGRNGSGKSTLLQVIAGTLPPSTGQRTVHGRVAALLELGSGFNPEFTGRENVYLNAAILGFNRDEIDELYHDIVEFADIGDYVNQPIKTYSTGMVMRLAFAVQVQVRPDILIIDEALAVGDALFQKRCFQKMEELRSHGVTLLFVSHDSEIVRTMTTTALLLDQGEMIAYGPSADVVLEYRRLLHNEEKKWLENQIKSNKKKQSQSKPQPEPQNTETPDVSIVDATPNQENGNQAEAKSFGDREAEILSVQIFSEKGEEASVFYPGEKMIFRIVTRVNIPLDHLNIGLRIRNKEGIKIYSWGTLNQDISIWSHRAEGEVFWDKSFSAGEIVTIDFESICTLGWNFYEVQASVSQENDRYYNNQRMLHWRDEAAFFHVQVAQHEYFFGGVNDLQMKANVRTSSKATTMALENSLSVE